MLKVFAAVPVKELSSAKTRLSKLLSPDFKEVFVLAMLRDVLDALMSSSSLSEVMVISSDPEILEEASRRGAVGIDEGEPRGINEALRLAVDEALRRGAEALLIVPCDVPLIKASDIEKLMSFLEPPPSMVISPSKNREGTNALLLAPPNVIALRFGPQSFQNHLEEASLRGVNVKIYESSSLALDIDEEEDLKILKRMKGEGRVIALLESFGFR
ncbi:MAG: 2-phospho-L-lactate guanylyltransferase [Thermoprotei archaeon]|nr:MAG: 2-phospho-L-lactate guanylyltransferase [Thermoprotei archaeon]